MLVSGRSEPHELLSGVDHGSACTAAMGPALTPSTVQGLGIHSKEAVVQGYGQKSVLPQAVIQILLFGSKCLLEKSKTVIRFGRRKLRQHRKEVFQNLIISGI